MSKLSELIASAFKKGYGKDELFQILLDKGYPQKEINSAFQELQPKSAVRTSEESSVSLGKKLGMLFSAPQEFFERVREESIGKSILMFLIVGVAVAAIGFVLGRIISSAFQYNSFIGINYFGLFGFFSVFLAVFYFIATFVYSGVSHLILRWMGGQGDYKDTYNACTYSLVPAVILNVIPLIGFFSLIYSVVLMTFGFSRYHRRFKGIAVVAALVPIIAVVVLLGLFLFYFLFRAFG